MTSGTHLTPHPTAVAAAESRIAARAMDWRGQLRQQVRSAADLRILRPDLDFPDFSGEVLARFPLGITPYYLSLVERADDSDPIWRQIAPNPAELVLAHGEQEDPLAERALSPVPNLVHRYRDRALLWVSDICFIYCRHCNRKHFTAQQGRLIAPQTLEAAIAYIRAHEEIREVILSGGDAFSLPDHHLAGICERLRLIPHLDILRLATRAPVVCPMRLTPSLAQALQPYHPIYIMTHFNHPREVTAEAAAGLRTFADHGFPLLNQMVLLRGVNDRPEVVVELGRQLTRHRCRPYYMFQGDAGPGLSGYHAPLEAGLEIIAAMRGFVSGLIVPHFAVDLPGGHGKITVQPDYLLSKDAQGYVFRSPKGETVSYARPSASPAARHELPRVDRGAAHLNS